MSIEIYLCALINTIVVRYITQFIWVVAQTGSISWLTVFSLFCCKRRKKISILTMRLDVWVCAALGYVETYMSFNTCNCYRNSFNVYMSICVSINMTIFRCKDLWASQIHAYNTFTAHNIHKQGERKGNYEIW